MRNFCLLGALALGLSLGPWGATRVAAGPLDCSSVSECGWTLAINGTEVANGNFVIDESGFVSIAPGTVTQYDLGDISAGVNSLDGEVDPRLSYAVAATNNGDSIATFAFAFNLPLDGISGPLDSFAEVIVGLNPTGDGNTAMIFPTSESGIVDSNDLVLDPFQIVDKGVDIGIARSTDVLASFHEEARGIVEGGPFDVMTVNLNFGLQPRSAATLIGNVVQTAQVPEPGAALLLLAAGGALAALRRTA